MSGTRYRAVPAGTDPTPEEFSLFVHLGEHLLAQKSDAKPELMLFDCWFWSGAEVPDWAAMLAESNAPGWTWCPWLTPRLADLTEAEQSAWSASVLTRATCPS